MTSTYYLFDMDMVLLYPAGYRAALQATVNYYTRAMGLGESLAPTADDIEAFESVGITSEWDSASICLAEIITRAHPAGAPADSFSQAIDNIQRHGATIRRPDYVALLTFFSQHRLPGEYAADAAYRHYQNGSGLNPAYENLLLNTRDIHRAPVQYIFQQYTLGDAFEATYGLPRIIDGDSFLLTHDTPSLAADLPNKAVVYTARPSLPPKTANLPTAELRGYPPEAELGAKVAGISHLPIVGYGAMQWLTAQVGGNIARRVKPNAVQALAALAIAIFGAERDAEAIIAAEQFVAGKPSPMFDTICAMGGRAVLFEDSPRSIAGAREAVQMLGAGWQFDGIGISAGGPKYDLLLDVADRVYQTINDALLAETLPIT